MAGEMHRKSVLEDGAEFPGWSFGAVCDRVCELVFNTSMVGYQEIVTDPSYAGQMVVMTYPLMGNYGMTDEDDETKVPVRSCRSRAFRNPQKKQRLIIDIHKI